MQSQRPVSCTRSLVLVVEGKCPNVVAMRRLDDRKMFNTIGNGVVARTISITEPNLRRNLLIQWKILQRLMVWSIYTTMKLAEEYAIHACIIVYNFIF